MSGFEHVKEILEKFQIIEKNLKNEIAFDEMTNELVEVSKLYQSFNNQWSNHHFNVETIVHDGESVKFVQFDWESLE